MNSNIASLVGNPLNSKPCFISKIVFIIYYFEVDENDI
nr:MAG TPA: hypothetical protein [Caudoviricetes sp.]